MKRELILLNRNHRRYLISMELLCVWGGSFVIAK